MGDVEQIDDTSCMAIFQYYPQIIVFEVRAVVFDDVLVVTEP